MENIRRFPHYLRHSSGATMISTVSGVRCAATRAAAEAEALASPSDMTRESQEWREQTLQDWNLEATTPDIV